MQTELVYISSADPDMQQIQRAAQLLKHGELVAFPTETVYGLGANGLDADACRRIYAAKGRPSDNPLILHIADIQELDILADEITENAKKLMDAFWPGPLTLIFQKNVCVPDTITGGLSTVAIRFPSHPVAQALIAAAGVPIAAPSANTSGKPSPTTAEHVLCDLDGKIPMILDGGPCDLGLESSIVDVSGEEPQLLRPGFITQEMLAQVLGTLSTEVEETERPCAPGMKYKHYAPCAPLVLVGGNTPEEMAESISALVQKGISEGKHIGILATEETKNLYPTGEVISVGTRSDLKTVAMHLFEALRRFDELGVSSIYAESFPETEEGLAIMNRLQKAAGYHWIHKKGEKQDDCTGL